ncbi:transcriptional regulator [Clostridium sp. 19966]|uniref:helix-turn-helix domain-containing protein n=1 Tax=Clostridium sp. 19966 TaxID=2768166 RepID=UPI0028DFB3A7|nr:helix-turn-helix transcriptional regulator [Clostridium sp. 19966]MDT8719098.1 transcriptional regulator [Clostridium sp. 19966]
MEILTTGEKIRRARIYKGLTLKDICGDMISVSKLSCIENNKIEAEPEILESISEKLGLDYEYLVQDIQYQIKNNIEELTKTSTDQQYESGIYYNLSYCTENAYYDLAFELVHLLFAYYRKNSRIDKIEEVLSIYFQLNNKSHTSQNIVTYNGDMGDYFYLNEEYDQAIYYYDNAINILNENKELSQESIAILLNNKVKCMIKLFQYGDIEESADLLKNYAGFVKNDMNRADIYKTLVLAKISQNGETDKGYEEQIYMLLNDSIEDICEAKLEFAQALFLRKSTEKAMEYIEFGISNYPAKLKEKKVAFVLNCVNELINNNILEEAKKICDDALNYAIMLDNINYIEKAYYFKSTILQKMGDYNSAEMYMNLSVDALMKYGNKKERYLRYMELGNMYYKLGQPAESIKYFNIAINVKKKL